MRRSSMVLPVLPCPFIAEELSHAFAGLCEVQKCILPYEVLAGREAKPMLWATCLDAGLFARFSTTALSQRTPSGLTEREEVGRQLRTPSTPNLDSFRSDCSTENGPKWTQMAKMSHFVKGDFSQNGFRANSFDLKVAIARRHGSRRFCLLRVLGGGQGDFPLKWNERGVRRRGEGVERQGKGPRAQDDA